MLKQVQHKNLRWLLRRGSPLPISNREVKPDCADGTAVMWESMSPPSFGKPVYLDRLFYFIGAACLRQGGSIRRLLLKTLSKPDRVFCLSKVSSFKFKITQLETWNLKLFFAWGIEALFELFFMKRSVIKKASGESPTQLNLEWFPI